MASQIDWEHIAGEENYPILKALILGDKENGVTRQMEYNVYDRGEDILFQSGSKVKILTFERKTCEWLQPTLFVKEFKSGVILLESIYSCTLENVGEILSRPAKLSDHEKEAIEFL